MAAESVRVSKVSTSWEELAAFIASEKIPAVIPPEDTRPQFHHFAIYVKGATAKEVGDQLQTTSVYGSVVKDHLSPAEAENAALRSQVQTLTRQYSRAVLELLQHSYQTSIVDSTKQKKFEELLKLGNVRMASVDHFYEIIEARVPDDEVLAIADGDLDALQAKVPWVVVSPDTVATASSSFMNTLEKESCDLKKKLEELKGDNSKLEDDLRDCLLLSLQGGLHSTFDRLRFHCEPPRERRLKGWCIDGPGYVDIMSSTDPAFDPQTKPYSLTQTCLNIEMKVRIEQPNLPFATNPSEFHAKLKEAIGAVSTYASLRQDAALRQVPKPKLWPSMKDAVYIVSDLRSWRFVHVRCPTSQGWERAAQQPENAKALEKQTRNTVFVSPSMPLLADDNPGLELFVCCCMSADHC